VRAERTWQRARQVSGQALAAGALIPLSTEALHPPEFAPFVLRRLLTAPPRHLRAGGPRPNPFLPWDRPLEVERLNTGHVVLLNKYPVQQCHLLVISDGWRPQGGWLQQDDWQAVAQLAADTGGLWFFNSSAVAGASQPHRHLQLLPRQAVESSCPLAPFLLAQLAGEQTAPPWRHALSARRDPLGGSDLPDLYREHCQLLGLGQPERDPAPLAAYNLLFDDDWFLTVVRVREHGAGFSVNGLGFAGYLLCTAESDLPWLRQHGPWELLRSVAAEP
jgi:ATP adenylyltransferase